MSDEQHFETWLLSPDGRAVIRDMDLSHGKDCLRTAFAAGQRIERERICALLRSKSTALVSVERMIRQIEQL